MFNTLSADRCFNIIDSILIKDSIEDTDSDGRVSKIRAKMDKTYGRIDISDYFDEDFVNASEVDNSPIKYTNQTENGYVGLEAPMG